MNTARDLERLIKDPTLDNVLAAGQSVLQRLPEDQRKEVRAKFRDIAAKAKPIRAALDLARRPGELGEALRGSTAQYLCSLPRPELTPIIRGFAESVVASNRERLHQWYSELLEANLDIAKVAVDIDRVAAEIFRLWPRQLIAKLPRAQKDRLIELMRKKLGVADEAEIVARLREIPRSLSLNVVSGRLVLTVDGEVHVFGEVRTLLSELKASSRFDLEPVKVEDQIRTSLADLRSGLITSS